MKILIIPDVHGRDFWVEPCKQIDKFDKIIFLGDYHDPYPSQVSIKQSRENLKLLKDFITNHKDKVICLLGNHDYSYITGFAKCRYDTEYEKEVKEFLESINLKVAYKIGNYIFTHSGILPRWANNFKLTIEDIFNLPIDSNVLQSVSPNRGGRFIECGSCIWGDLDEYHWAEHYADYYQIFGHTQLILMPAIEKDYACLDCRKAFILNTETKEIKEL